MKRPTTPISTRVEPFDHSQGVKELTGMRGRRLIAKTGFTSGRPFSTAFPDVWIDDNGDVEIDDRLVLVPIDTARQWLTALLEELDR